MKTNCKIEPAIKLLTLSISKRVHLLWLVTPFSWIFVFLSSIHQSSVLGDYIAVTSANAHTASITRFIGSYLTAVTVLISNIYRRNGVLYKIYKRLTIHSTRLWLRWAKFKQIVFIYFRLELTFTNDYMQCTFI